MPELDEYSAIWVSHSSINDYLKCPRAYYLNNMYKNPKTRRKISLMFPPLALGQAVHATLDSVSTLPSTERFATPLTEKYDELWETVTGKKGGFLNEDEEKEYKERGRNMIEGVMKNPGPLLKKTLKIKQELPHYWISPEENIILCGKIDWLVYNDEDDSIEILDFKSGRVAESSDSLQLKIYYLLATHCQARKVKGVYYWYLDRDNSPVSMPLPTLEQSEEAVLSQARRIKLARQMDHFKCSSGKREGCIHCAPLEVVINGKAEYVGINDHNQELYILNSKLFNYSL